MKQIRIILLIVISLLSINIFAQSPIMGSANFKGTIGSSKVDSLWISVWKEYVSGVIGMQISSVMVNTMGSFDFQIKNISKPCRFKISVFKNGKINELNTYYAEPKDDITINFISHDQVDSMSFSGTGSTKYNVKNLIDQQYSNFNLARSKIRFYNVTDTNVMKDNFLQLYRLVKNGIKEEENLLSSNKDRLTPIIRNIFLWDFGFYHSTWYTHIGSLYKDASASYKIKKNIKAIHNEFKEELTFKPDETMGSNGIYFRELYHQERIDLLVNSASGTYKLEKLYQNLKNKYSGLLRERLLTDFFLDTYKFEEISNFRQETFDSLIVDSEPLIQSPLLKKSITDIIMLSKGRELNYTDFADINGINVNLKSLKGKVVLLDMWGTGCSACAMFHKKFEKEIYPLFQQNKNFVLFSIGVDKEKKRWLESIDTDKYTNRGHFNVFTNGLGLDHPFTKYYNINSMPFILVIDKNGKIFAKIWGSFSSTKIADLIQQALNGDNT